MDLSDTGNQPNDEYSKNLAKSMFASADIRVTIKFPYKVIETSGELSSDKKSVTWRPKIGEITKMGVTVPVPSINYFRLVAGLVSVVCFSIIGFSILNERRKKISNNEEII